MSCGVSFQLYISAPSELHHLEPSCAAPATKNGHLNFECGNLDLTAAGFFSPHFFTYFFQIPQATKISRSHKFFSGGDFTAFGET